MEYKTRDQFADDASYREQFNEYNSYYFDEGWEWCKIVENDGSIHHYIIAPRENNTIRVVHPESTTSNGYAIEDEIFLEGPDWLHEHKDAHFCNTPDGGIDFDRYDKMRAIVIENRRVRLENINHEST